MNSGIVLIAAGGFLLGGAYSVARLENASGRRSVGQWVTAAALFVLAVYLVVAGILQATQ